MRAKDLILVQLKKQPMRHLCSGEEKLAKKYHSVHQVIDSKLFWSNTYICLAQAAGSPRGT